MKKKSLVISFEGGGRKERLLAAFLSSILKNHFCPWGAMKLKGLDFLRLPNKGSGAKKTLTLNNSNLQLLSTRLVCHFQTTICDCMNTKKLGDL